MPTMYAAQPVAQPAPEPFLFGNMMGGFGGGYRGMGWLGSNNMGGKAEYGNYGMDRRYPSYGDYYRTHRYPINDGVAMGAVVVTIARVPPVHTVVPVLSLATHVVAAEPSHAPVSTPQTSHHVAKKEGLGGGLGDGLGRVHGRLHDHLSLGLGHGLGLLDISHLGLVDRLRLDVAVGGDVVHELGVGGGHGRRGGRQGGDESKS